MNRKQRRASEAQMGKDGNEELAAKVAMFGKLPEECTACESPVRLYCPTCWDTAREVVTNFLQQMEKDNES